MNSADPCAVSHAAMQNREVAVYLRITEDTVKATMKRLLAKLDAKDRTNAVPIAL